MKYVVTRKTERRTQEKERKKEKGKEIERTLERKREREREREKESERKRKIETEKLFIFNELDGCRFFLIFVAIIVLLGQIVIRPCEIGTRTSFSEQKFTTKKNSNKSILLLYIAKYEVYKVI